MAQRASPVRALDADRRVLGDLLSRTFGSEVSVRILDRRPCEFKGRWPSEILDLELADGSRLSIFRKAVGLSGHPDKSLSDKEIRMYDRVLKGEHLPVPRYFGARLDESKQTHELYLEYVDAYSLKYQDITHWYRASEAIARLHAHFADRIEDLGSEPGLPILDAAYYLTWADRARTELGGYLPELTPGLEELLAGYDPVVALLAGEPRTLVHNDLGSRNVVVDTSREPARVCIIDWENASVGCGVVDLTHLTYGLEDEQRSRLCDTYFSALVGTPLAPVDSGHAARLAAAGEVHRVVYRLGRCRRRGYDRAAVQKLLAHAVRFRELV